MADRMAFLLFGDQSLDTHGFLAEFCREGNPSILAKAFLERATHALREEVDGLTRLQQANIPSFRTLYQLNEKYHTQDQKHPGIDSALLCIAQLAHYIDRAEKEPEDWTADDQTFFVGFCTGLFAASAIASTPTVSTLIPLAIQTVLLAFRTGSYVGALAETLSPHSSQPEPWTLVFPEAGEEAVSNALSDFYKSNNIPSTSRPYVSAVSSSNVAVSGPPATLRAVVEKRLFGSNPLPIPVYGPYHAQHLHSSADIEKMLQLDSPGLSAVLEKAKPRSAIMSSNGTWFNETDTKELFKAVVWECLNEPLRFNRAFESCVQAATSFKGHSCLVISFGPTQAADTLAKLIQNQTKLDVVVRKSLRIHKESIGSSIGNHGSQLGRCRLAIVGMAGRFPDAASHEKLWELLAKGLDVHRVVPKDRFPIETHVDPTGKTLNASHTPYGCWIEEPGLFDPRFFNMSPREAFQTDPMQRMALTTAYEALEMSGYVPNRTPSTRLDRIGTFYGQTSDDWREINAAQEVDTYYITGGVRAFGPGRINYHFGFSGPSLCIDTACSSSAAALQVACTSLWANECDTAIVGGLSCMTNSDIFAGLSRGQFLSKTGPCATFDNGADGYCRADACASVIVKRLDHALADKDNVLAVILGTSTNHSADAVSITHPHGPTQSILSTAILDEAGVDPHDVDYVEMHGTGTQAGDSTEMVSVTNVFAPAKRKRPADRPLYLGSVKSNVGHGEAASGVTAVIKVLLMLQKNAIPPHVGIKKEINKTFPADLSERNVNIAFHMTPLVRKDGRPRKIFINNFSAAGGNTGLLLEEGPKYEPASADPRTTHIIAVTGKSKAAMIRNAERLVAWMEKNPDTPVSHVAYTTTARRIQHYWRMNVAASNLAEAQVLIKDRLKENFVPISTEQPKVVFLFTGQGSHYAGLGKDLYAHFGVFREAIDEFNRLSLLHGFPSFLPLIDGSESDVQNPSPVIVQLGLCCFEMALARLWASWGIRPGAVLGHSLGEYAALNVAGVLSASDTIYLVGVRAKLLVNKCTAGTHAMLAIQGPVPAIKEVLGVRGDTVNVACINGPRETVLSGTAEEVAEISQLLTNSGFKCTQLKVPFAFHSAQVEPILDSFEELSQSVVFQRPKIAVISPLLGKLIENEPINPPYLRNHARDAVNFLGGLVSAQEAGVIDEKTAWLEVGPHPVCANMVKAAFGASTIAVPTLRRNEPTYKTLHASLCTLHSAGLNIDWSEYHKDFDSSVRLLDLPAYSFDEKNYWIQYTGDWCLTKNRVGTKPAALLEAPKPKISTSAVHKVTKEEIKGDVCIIETETNLSRDDIRPAVTGHVVNGAPLFPSTIYAEMGMTICDYAYKLVRPGTKKIGVNICDVEVPKTLIFDETLDAHILRCTATCNPAKGTAELVFHTLESGKKTDHCYCKVYYEDPEEWLSEFDRVNYLIKSRIDHLTEAEKVGKASKIGRGLAYKLFTALVDYEAPYKGMEEVILDSDTCEATAKVVFPTSGKEGNWFFNPYWLDSCCHISGFIINGTDAVDSREQVYISHGWGYMKMAEKLDGAKTYRSYIRMQPVRGTKMMAGDAYIFDGDRIVGVVGQIKFQSIPRKVLNMVLPPRGKALSGAAPAPSAKKPTAAASMRPAAPAKAQQVTPANISTVNAKLAGSVVTAVLDILAKEIGVTEDELADNIAFTDFGVDSLMSLTVSGRLREELELDIDSNAFVDHSTIGAFKKYLAQFETSQRKESISSDGSGDSTSTRSDAETPEMESESDITTPLEYSDNGSIKGGDASSDIQEIVRGTICEEMGVEVDEIIAAPDLAALGMDSLMSLSILGTLREKTGLDIPSDLFTANPSLLAVEKALGIGPRPKPAPAAAKPAKVVEPRPPRVINTHPGNTTATIVKPPRPATFVDNYPHRKATSVLLQGNIRSATKNLFMVPDGSGCATSYTEIGAISPDWAVWGLFSPFMKTPEEFNCGVYGMAQKFITEIKRRQPTGPYSLAGWSAGGVIAFEMVNQLVKAGDAVDHLIIIDAPCPVTIEPLPRSLHAWFASIGLLGDGDSTKIPSWLLPHFAASVTALSNYTAEPIPDDKCPRVTAIWCEDGVCKLPTDPRPDPYPTGHALFLLDNRTDFGPNRWDEYLDYNKIRTMHMPGNHFSMMHGDLAKKLGDFIRAAVTEA
ncbi:Conidial yellow pigment biosynthesis polyketide synthase [Scedosporium apiospermum]|uniref:Conidial yellow pigment biosynthesis polyketide synthase n=1 Tax=Pseudallescheria apiosperma TaxID=563466 RepID=A0A084G055_PSEDA|nr:Conidial yellow pigment biosynthesis polyketide synthase [Scedosporium apiospermum]KEZ40717.1 Conidial yellow pigment biosynthesis polyketide synthase [Scedosporium apiospermum]